MQDEARHKAEIVRANEFQEELLTEVESFLNSPPPNVMKIRTKKRRLGLTTGLAKCVSRILLENLLPAPTRIIIVTNTGEQSSFIQKLRSTGGITESSGNYFYHHRENITCLGFVELWTHLKVKSLYENGFLNAGEGFVELCIVDDYFCFKKKYLELLQRMSKKLILAKTGAGDIEEDIDIEFIQKRRLQLQPVVVHLDGEEGFSQSSTAVLENVD